MRNSDKEVFEVGAPLPDYDTLWSYLRACMLSDFSECTCCHHIEWVNRYQDCDLDMLGERQRGIICPRLDFNEAAFRREYGMDK